VKEKTLDFCKRQAFREALEKAVEMVATDKFESVVDLMKHAVSVGMPNTVGHDFLEDAEARFVKINRNPCPTGLDVIDSKDILRGGLGRGELGVVVAATGVGKSHWLVAMGAHALKLGKNVVHYTFELTETSVGLRYDSNLCGISSSDVPDMKEDVLKTYETMELGRLIIKEYPTASASALHFRALLNELQLKKSFVPDIIFIDYLNICSSARIKPGANVNSYSYIKAIAEELRGLAVEFSVPVVSATQTTRSGFTNSDPGLEDTSESFGLPATADFMFALISTEELEQLNQIMVKQLKNRYGDPNNYKRFVIGIDRAKMRLYDVEQSAQVDIADAGHDDKPLNTFGERERPNKFEGFKI
jgi:replicative DNA helicase